MQEEEIFTKNTIIDYETGKGKSVVEFQALKEDRRGFKLKVNRNSLRVHANVEYLQESYKRHLKTSELTDKEYSTMTTLVGKFACMITYTNRAGIICKLKGTDRVPASQEDLITLLGAKERQGLSYIRQFLKLRWIRKEKEIANAGEKSVRVLYKVNYPAVEITTSSNYLYLEDYKANREEIILSNWIRPSLNMLDTFYVKYYGAVTLQDDESLIKEDEKEEPDYAVFEEYVLNNESEKHPLFHLEDGKLKSGYNNTNCFFLVNESESGNRKKDDITGYTNLYLDFDAGKNEDGLYKDLESVNNIKQGFLEVIHYLPTPTCITETRNGYHVIYSLENTDADMWHAAQTKLVNAVEICDNIKDSTRILRVPGTVWNKNSELYSPFMCELKETNKVRYHVQAFINELDERNEELKEIVNCVRDTFDLVSVKKSEVIHESVKEEPKEEKEGYYNKRVEQFKNHEFIDDLKISERTTTMSKDDFIDYVKTYDMRKLFDLPKVGNVRCLLHNDKTPSASVLIDNKGGYRLYCHSTRCNHSNQAVDNFEVFGKVAGLSFFDSMYYLAELFNVSLS